MPSLEAQASNVADEVAYLTHDIHDALEHGLLVKEECDSALSGSSLWRRSSVTTEGELQALHPEGWPGVDESRLRVRRLHRNLISQLMADVLRESARRGAGLSRLAAARDSAETVIGFSTEMREQVDELRRFLCERVYESPLVSRQNAKADHILERLFTSLTANTRLLPTYVQQRINGSAEPRDIAREAAYFLASLTDRDALDLYGELFVPIDRAMGHHVRQASVRGVT